MRPEPQLEELSAYLDHELPGAQRQELESHLAGCETCRRRLESLRQTVHAVGALPSEVPPRAFTIPPQRAQRSRLTPAGWAAGLTAAAVLGLVVLVALTSPHGGGGTAGGTALQFQRAAPQASKAAGNPDELSAAPAYKALQNETSVANTAKEAMRIGTDSTSYRPGGTMTVRVVLEGSPVQPPSSSDAGVQLLLVSASAGSNGPGRILPAMDLDQRSSAGTLYQRAYPVSALGLGSGDYRLIAIWTPPNRSDDVLVAEVRIFLTRS
jgi:hypothetical protein